MVYIHVTPPYGRYTCSCTVLCNCGRLQAARRVKGMDGLNQALSDKPGDDFPPWVVKFPLWLKFLNI
jgi:hypothetical protein